ncbi:BQ2448_6406 [Microbotryum intermedium]|uniref:BQ2448_6406 protein n=1 Tax=Microbotryum intermedium TaxID=269621 RepID=A0A238FS90_9BASI|nr:BQ2448_6406 [Microbotryum intermedium]
MSPDIQFKGYAIHDTNKYTEFEVIDFMPKTFGDYDIEIKINCCGVCSSDVHTVTGGWGEPILPLITGHEIAGIVTRVGFKSSGEFKVGDRAGVGAQVCSCFECDPCKTDNENYCVKGGVDTYNAKYENGDIAHGGYSTGIRVHERFVFRLPDALSDEDAAPMLCGGLTVFAPLKNHGVKEGSKVAIVGIGGLGHFAIQFAKALGAEVTAFSHQADKEEDARAMGVTDFVLTSKKDFAKDYAQKFDLVLSTVDDAAGLPIGELISMLRLFGVFHSVGLPDKPIPELKFQELAGNGASIAVSHIGSKKQANEMLALAAEKGVKTWKEVLPMKDAGKGVQGVKDNKVRYRYVLKVDI